MHQWRAVLLEQVVSSPNATPFAYTFGAAHTNFTVNNTDCSAKDDIVQDVVSAVRATLPGNNISAAVVTCEEVSDHDNLGEQ